MRPRQVEQILRDWRAAEAELPPDEARPETELLERIGFLRAEYEAAMAELQDEAAELARRPGADLTADRSSAP